MDTKQQFNINANPRALLARLHMRERLAMGSIIFGLDVVDLVTRPRETTYLMSGAIAVLAVHNINEALKHRASRDAALASPDAPTDNDWRAYYGAGHAISRTTTLTSTFMASIGVVDMCIEGPSLRSLAVVPLAATAVIARHNWRWFRRERRQLGPSPK